MQLGDALPHPRGLVAHKLQPRRQLRHLTQRRLQALAALLQHTLHTLSQPLKALLD